MTGRQKAQLLLSRFPGRDDCHGAGSGACVKEPFTESVAWQHITGQERTGRYPLREDGRTGILAVDIDENNLYIPIEYRARCKHYEIAVQIEKSKSKGFHVWWLLKDLTPAWKARLVANYILDECDLLGSVEVFPKQDLLKPGGYGSYINLPLFGRDVKKERTVFLDPGADYRPYRDQWSFLASVTRISEARLDEIIQLNELDVEPLAQVIKDEAEVVAGYQGNGLPCFATMMREGVDEGMRNEAALRLSVSLYRTGIPKKLGLLMMREWNIRNRPPLGTDELVKAVHNGYLGAYGYGCFSGLIQRYCHRSCPIFRKYNQGNGRRTNVNE